MLGTVTTCIIQIEHGYCKQQPIKKIKQHSYELLELKFTVFQLM